MTQRNTLSREEIEPLARLYLSAKNADLFMLLVDTTIALKVDAQRLSCPYHCGKKLGFEGEKVSCCQKTPSGMPCGLLYKDAS